MMRNNKLRWAGFSAVWIAVLLAGSAWAAAAMPPEIPAWQYSVRPGDNLLNLGQRYLASPAQWTQVQRLNHIADPRRIPVGTVLRIPANLLRSTPGAATLKATHGKVRWRLGSGTWQDASVGQALSAGAELQTEDQASAVLELANGTQLSVHARSVVVLDTLSLYAGGLMADTRVRLQQGQTEIKDNPLRRDQQHLRILTPSAQATVRGTVFRVGVQGDDTRQETVEGAVSLAAAGRSVLVAQAQGSLARAGQPPTAPKALLPAPDLGSLPALYEQLPLRITLPTQAGAASWWAQVAADDSFAPVLAETAGNGPVLNFADLPNGRYVLRLRAVDALGLQGLSGHKNITVHARPFAPTLQSPRADAVVREARPLLRWTGMVDAASYRVQVTAAANFAETSVDQLVSGTQVTPSQDLALGQHFWRVASVSAEGVQGPWSTPSALVFRPGPGQPALETGAVRIDGQALLVQLARPPAGQHYRLSLSSSANAAIASANTLSRDGQARLAPIPDQTPHLAVWLVDDADGTIGPAAVQQVELPRRDPALWLLLVPLLLLL